MKLNRRALGLSLGLLWGFGLLIGTLLIQMRGGGDHLMLLSQVYIGYSVSVAGAVVGLVYGFVDGFLCGWLIAWLYNALAVSKSAT